MGKRTKPSGWDVCCSGKRPDRDFDSSYAQVLTSEQTYVLLESRRIGITFLMILQLLIQFVWQLTSLVPGAARYDGANGTVNALTHFGWWTCIEITVLFVGARVTLFRLHYSKRGIIEKDARSADDFMWYYLWLLFIAAVANVVHFALSIAENSSCTSTLCANNQGWLITMIVLFIVLALLEFWLMFRTWTYKKDLRNAVAYERIDLDMTNRHTNPRRTRNEGESAPSAPPYNPSEGLEQPLMIQHQNNKKNKKKNKFNTP